MSPVSALPSLGNDESGQRSLGGHRQLGRHHCSWGGSGQVVGAAMAHRGRAGTILLRGGCALVPTLVPTP